MYRGLGFKTASLLIAIPVPGLVFGGSGHAQSQVHATGSSGGCGPKWTVAASPNVGTKGSSLSGVAAVADDDVWAVGNSGGSAPRPLAEHWDGSAWKEVAVPGSGYLAAVAASASDDVWAVGATSFDNPTTLTEHWDGKTWKVVASPNPGAEGRRLTGVLALSNSSVWAVGWYDAISGAQAANKTMTLLWNGKKWRFVPSPSPGPAFNLLGDVVGLSGDDVWAVGDYLGKDFVSRTLTLHWDGKKWHVVASPNVSTKGSFLSSATAIAANDLWTVGDYQTGLTATRNLALHWDGTAWRIVKSPNPGTKWDVLGSVAAVSPEATWAVGTSRSGGATRTLTLVWDSKTWKVAPSPNVGASDNHLTGLVATPGGTLWAVGSHGKVGSSASRTLVLHRCGS